MDQRKVWVFFYGSYINFKVLNDIGFKPDVYEVARLDGFDIEIEPIVNLYPSDKDCIYGIVTQATHADLDLLYEHARKKLGGNYLPEAVLVKTENDKWRPSLCFIANSLPKKLPTDAYLDTMVESAKEYGFPTWYIEKIETFRPTRSFVGYNSTRRNVVI